LEVGSKEVDRTTEVATDGGADRAVAAEGAWNTTGTEEA